jgi:hypothetical protein
MTFIRELIHRNDNINTDRSGVGIFVERRFTNDKSDYLNQTIGSLFST